MTLIHSVMLVLELIGGVLLLVALVGVTLRMLFLKSNAYIAARTVWLPILANCAFIWVLLWAGVRISTLLILENTFDTVLKDGELPFYISGPFIAIHGLGLVVFLASTIVRCYRLILLFFVNQKLQEHLRTRSLKGKQNTEPQIASPLPEPAVPVEAASPPPESAVSSSSASPSALTANAQNPETPQLTPRDKQSWFTNFMITRSRIIKKMTKAHVTVPTTVVLAFLLYIFLAGRTPLLFLVDIKSVGYPIINVTGAVSITILVGIISAICAILLRNVDEVFNQSREMFMLLIVNISVSIAHLSDLIPFWNTVLHELGVMITITIYLFVSGVYPLRQALKFRLIQLQNVVPSAENVEEFLRQPLALQYFTTYIKREYALENLVFYIDSRKFRELTTEGKRKESERLGTHILDRFFGPNSVLELNLPGSLASDIFERGDRFLKTNEDLPADLFVQAEKIILHSIAFDTFPRFKASAAFEELRQRFEVEERVIDGII